MISMAKDKVTVTLDPEIIAYTDADAASEGLNRSEYVERTLRDVHNRLRARRAVEGTAALLADPDFAAQLAAARAWTAPFREARSQHLNELNATAAA
jgi:hypothetical protein